MIPLIDTMVVPGLGTAVLAVSPVLFGMVAAAVVAGMAWMVRGVSEELRRQAARELEARSIRLAPRASESIAAS